MPFLIPFSFQPNGANLTGGNLGSSFTASGSAPTQIVPFNGAAVGAATLPKGAWSAVLFSGLGALVGMLWMF